MLDAEVEIVVARCGLACLRAAALCLSPVDLMRDSAVRFHLLLEHDAAEIDDVVVLNVCSCLKMMVCYPSPAHSKVNSVVSLSYHFLGKVAMTIVVLLSQDRLRRVVVEILLVGLKVDWDSLLRHVSGGVDAGVDEGGDRVLFRVNEVVWCFQSVDLKPKSNSFPRQLSAQHTVVH